MPRQTPVELKKLPKLGKLIQLEHEVLHDPLVFTKELVTPDYARELLSRNDHNRALYQKNVIRFSKDMTAGTWKENTGECILISETGALLNGQTRLNAVIASGASIYFHICRGVKDDTFSVLDTGKPRSPGDAFKIAGVEHYALVPAIMAFYNALVAGYAGKAEVGYRCTNSDLLAQYEQNPQWWDETAKSAKRWTNNMGRLLSASALGGFYSRMWQIDPVKADHFIEELTSGLEISNNAVYLLRQRLISSATSREGLKDTAKKALVIKAWNFYRAGKGTKQLKWIDGETYPTLQ